MAFYDALSRHLSSTDFLRDAGYVNGNWIGGNGEATFDVVNPATGERLATLPEMGAAETAAAIDAAYRAQPAWAARPAKDRSALLRKWHDLIVANVDELAAILTAEMGKPLPEARGEVLYGASYIEWYAEEAKRINGETIPSPSADRRMMVIRQPVGVVGTITPWNFPSAMIARKIAPALAVGCTVVSKPAEQTPLSAIALAILAEKAGIPAGVFNLVLGTDGPAIGKELCFNPKVRKISFTGSTEVGRILMRQCSDQIKKVSLELGGKDPGYVMEDADLDAAVDTLMDGATYNSGQCCCGIERIYVNEKLYDAFVEKSVAWVSNYKLGNPLDPETTLGPMAHKRFAATVRDQIADAVSKGAKALIDPKLFPADDGGAYIAPQILVDVDHSMEFMTEETFGPALGIMKVKSDAEALALMNDSKYGLTASLWTQDAERAARIAGDLETGTVFMNRADYLDPALCWTGVKETGRGGSLSVIGFHNLTRPKSYHFRKA